jgi:sulfate adenylyltransferase subunit 1 (EFTu-like GTPase family)
MRPTADAAMQIVDKLESTVRRTIRHAMILTALLSFVCCWAVSHVYLGEFRSQLDQVREQQRETEDALESIRQCLELEPATTATNP